MLLRHLRSAALGLALTSAALAAAPAMAGSTSGTFAVTANVVAACKINTTPSLAFGNYDPANANATAALAGQTQLSISCTKSTTATVSLDQGLNAASGSTCTAPSRQMVASTNKLAYGIYLNTARDQVWGCTTGTNTASFTASAAGTPNLVNVYGSIPGGQDLPAGSYSDTVTYTVAF